MDQEKEREKIIEHLQLGKEMIHLTAEEVKNAGLTLDDTLALTRKALLAHGNKDFEMPPKFGVHPFQVNFFHAMPAYVPPENAVGIKWIASYPENPANYNLPQVAGLLVINDPYTGSPLAIMDANYITAMRTPAVTALAAAALHPDAETFGMFGCGVQGIEHCRFVTKTLKNLKKLYIYDINKQAMDSLFETLQPELPIEIIRGKDPEFVTKSCQVLSSATVILKKPMAVVKGEWVSSGQTIIPCDLNTFWDPVTAHRADKYIVDSAADHRHLAEAGYFPDGLPEIACETGEVIAGKARGRDNDDQLIFCSNIGMAVCDVVVGKKILLLAIKKGLGRKIAL